MTLRSILSAGFALVLASLVPSAQAEIYALGFAEDSGDTLLREVDTGAESPARVANCCSIGVGTPTFDVLGNRAYFVAQNGGAQQLVRFDYASGGSERLALDPGFSLTHLEYHAGSNLLYALGRELASGNVVMATVNPSTAQISVRASLPAPCCTLKAGVSTLVDSGNLGLLAVVRNGQQEAILPFDFTTNGLAAEIALPAGMQLGDLARHPASGTVWGLAHDPATGLGQLIAVGPAPTFTITPVGSGVAGCCFIQAGAAAIDQTANALVILGQDAAGDAPRVLRFSLADGSRSAGAAQAGHALFQEFGLDFDALFSDGFETP